MSRPYGFLVPLWLKKSGYPDLHYAGIAIEDTQQILLCAGEQLIQYFPHVATANYQAKNHCKVSSDSYTASDS
jgi:hypothetical protein